MPIWEIPREMLRQTSESWQMIARTIQGGPAASGFIPSAVSGGGGIWQTNSEGIYLRTVDHVLYWRSLDNYCEEGANPVIVPMCDRRHFPAPLDEDGDRITANEGIPHDDETPHDDDAPYFQPLVVASSVSAAALNAVTMQISMDAGGDLKAGMFFSIEHATWNWRLYNIRTAIEASAGVWDVEFRPRLREAVPGSTPIEFDTPRCLMKLATPDALRLIIERRRFAQPSWAFIECGRIAT